MTARGSELATGYVSITASAEGVGQAIAQQFQQAQAGAAQAGQASGKKFGDAFGKLAGIATGAGLAAMVKGAADAEQATFKLQAQLGLTAAEAKRFGADAKDLFANNFVGSIDEANDAIKSVINNIGGMRTASDKDLQSITSQVSELSQAFGVDLGDVTKAVGQEMKTGLAKNATEALDNIAVGFQKGVDKSGDFLDTLNEYGVQFHKLGIDGTTATGLLSQGLQAGARDADLVADALKEFSIRAVDGSTTTAQGFKDLGLSAHDMAEAIGHGGKTASDATELVLNKLKAIKDPALQAQAAVALFGTQSEDLGKALYALDLDTAAKGMGNVAGAAQNVSDQLSSGANASITTFWQQLQTTGITIGQELLPKLTPLLSIVGEIGKDISSLVGGFLALPGPIKITAVAVGVLGLALASASKEAGSFKGGMSALGSTLKNGVIFAGVASALATVSEEMQRGQKIADDSKGHIDGLADAYKGLGGKANDSIRQIAAQNILQADGGKVAAWAKGQGIAISDLVDAYLQLPSGDATRKKLEAFAKLTDAAGGSQFGRTIEGWTGIGDSVRKTQDEYQSYSDSIRSLLGENATAVATAADLAKSEAKGVNDAAESHRENSRGLVVEADNYRMTSGAQDRYITGLQAAGKAEAGRTATLGDIANAAGDLVRGFVAVGNELAKVPEDPFAQMNLDISELGDSTSKTSTELASFGIQVDKITGRNVSLEDATKNLNDQVRAMAQAFKDGTEATHGNIESLITASGAIDTTTEAGSKLYDSVSAYSGAYNNSVIAAEDAAGAHATVAQKVDAARKAADTARQKFLDQADSMGISKDKALKLADQMGILEGKKITPKTLHLDAKDDASPAVDALDKKVQGLKDKTVTLTVNAAGGKVVVQSDGSFNAGNGVTGSAKGGMIFGPGTGTSDSILHMLSNGEGINTADAMSKPANRRAMEFMNAGGVIPGFASGGMVNVAMGERGNIDRTLAGVAAIFGNADKSASSANSAAAAAAASIPASSAGVQQWAGLATQALTMLGQFSPSHLAEMLHQMDTESSGNPAAINLYDINAQNGVPSKGLMQVIPPTFATYALPGYNSNIWDPLSNMLASINYVMHQYGSIEAGYRGVAYATGGRVFGPGSGTSDSFLARVSNGEGVNTASAMSHPENVAAMHYMNAGGVLPGFANGGLVTTGQLAGLSDPSYGTRQTNVIGALGQLAQEIADARSQAAQDASAQHAADVQALHDRNAARGADKAYEDAKDAQHKAKTKADQVTAAQNVAAALASKKAADATAAASKLVADNAAVTAQASKGNAYAALDAQRAMQGTYQRLQQTAAQVDSITSRLATHQDQLAGLRGDKAQAIAGFASSISGFDGGITGHSDSRNTAGLVLNGQKYALSKIQGFRSDIAKLSKEGLSADLLNELESKFGSGGEVTAHALATGSIGQVRQANYLQGQIDRASNAAAQYGPAAQFDRSIKAQADAVKSLSGDLRTTNSALLTYAGRVESVVEALKHLQLHMDAHGVVTLIDAHYAKAKGQS